MTAKGASQRAKPESKQSRCVASLFCQNLTETEPIAQSDMQLPGRWIDHVESRPCGFDLAWCLGRDASFAGAEHLAEGDRVERVCLICLGAVFVVSCCRLFLLFCCGMAGCHVNKSPWLALLVAMYGPSSSCRHHMHAYACSDCAESTPMHRCCRLVEAKGDAGKRENVG